MTDLRGPLPADIVTRFWDRIGLCSCGNPQTALRQLLDALERHNPPGPNFDGPPLEWVDEGSNLLVCYVLDSWRLTEHGSSVYGAWLTAEGVALRDALRVVDLDSVLDA